MLCDADEGRPVRIRSSDGSLEIGFFVGKVDMGVACIVDVCNGREGGSKELLVLTL